MSEDYKIKLAKIRTLKSDLKNVYISDVIEASTKKKVIPLSNDDESKLLITEISNLANNITTKYRTKRINRETYDEYFGKKTKSFRNNEVGKLCEYLIKSVFEENKEKFKTIKEIVPLGGSGYPDLKILTKKEIIFLEIKATSKPEVGSPRDFYYTPGAQSDKKICADGLHILLGFITNEIDKGEFNLTGYKLVDISKVKVSLKPEFNTDNKGIYNSETIIH